MNNKICDTIKESEHTELCLWFNNHENIKKVFEKIGLGTNITITKVSWEYPISNGNYIVGYPDFIVYYDADEAPNGKYCIVEIKPHIRMEGENSVGKVMRQLKTYEHYLPGKKLLLVTMTPDYKDVFESQGIHYFVWEEPDLHAVYLSEFFDEHKP